MRKIATILVIDNLHFRKYLRLLLEEKFNMHILAEVCSAEEFLELPDYWMAHLIFMDIHLPVMSGIQLTQTVLWMHPQLRIIAIGKYGEKVYIDKVIEAGFMGCLININLHLEIATCIESVMNKQFYFPREMEITAP
jgi:DNA-binding NarL/FixJ family response regulator